MKTTYDNVESIIVLIYIKVKLKFSTVLNNGKYFQEQTSLHHANDIASLSLWKMLNLPQMYTLQLAQVLCDVWQMDCPADNMADSKSHVANVA